MINIKKFILTFSGFLLTLNLFCQSQMIDQVVGVVGDDPVLYSDIETQYLQMMKNNQDNYTGVDFKCSIFEEMLYQKLLIHQARIDSLDVTDKEVDEQLDRRIRMLVSQIGSEKKLEEYFNKPIVELKAYFRDMLRDQMVADKMQNKIVGDIKVTPSEIREYFKNLPKDSLPKLNTQVEVEQIMRTPVISEQEKLRIKEQLNGFRETVLATDSESRANKFAALARLYSEDAGSSPHGGELGFMGRTDLVPEFAAVAFSLKEGEISRIVETEYGYHIIMLIERKGEQIDVRHILIAPKVDPYELLKTKSLLDSVISLIKKDTLTFNKAVEKFSDDQETRYNGGVLVNPLTGNSRFDLQDLEEIDPSAVYEIKTMKPGDISEPFETKDQNGKTLYKVIRLKNLYPPHVANLQDDYQIIQNMALSEKKHNIIDDWIKKELQSTYVHINDSFKNCQFKYSGWVK